MDSQSVNSRTVQIPITEEFAFENWNFTGKQSKSILPSVDPCTLTYDNVEMQPSECDFCFYQKNLSHLHQWPEMIFPRNKFILQHSPSSATIEFNCMDALKLVDAEHDWVKVSCTQEWSEARKNCEFITNAGKSYDWTFSTNYSGTLTNFKSVTPTDERINLQKLMTREKILFYQEMTLYEDELADNGCSWLTLKFRCMPSCFFALLRFYLRVDRVLVRINDSRLFWEPGKNYLLREYTSKQKFFDQMSMEEREKYLDVNEISKHLITLEERIEKLQFE